LDFYPDKDEREEFITSGKLLYEDLLENTHGKPTTKSTV
jgi:hypothetical protein